MATRKVVRRHTIPRSYRLFMQACGLMWRHWEVFGGILLIYGLLNFLLIGGLSGASDLQNAKDAIGNAFTGQFGQLTTGLTLFTFLIASGTGTAASGVASAYQTILLVTVSLALIWALRQLYAGNKIRVRDAFYQGMYPLVQFVLVTLYIGLQLIPAVVGSFLYSALVANESPLIVVFWQQLVVGAVCFLLVLLTIYRLCSTLFALHIVTLQGMTPWRSIRNSRDITKYRRVTVLWKLLFLIPAIVLPAAFIMIPIVLFATIIAVPVFFILTVVAVGVVHSYLYTLYRELIVE